MIIVKTPEEIERMREAGGLVALILRALEEMVKPGIPLTRLDEEAERIIRERHARPLFKGYRGYPSTICASVNEQVVHGIPGHRLLKEGDIVSLDVGVSLNDYAGDAARTVPVGRISPEARKLIDACRGALERATAAARSGAKLSDVSRAIQRHAESHGCSVVRAYTGHGIGRQLHEEPQVPNFVGPHGCGGNDPVLARGMTLAIEPMLNAGGHKVKVLQDGWTVVTEDGSLSAHFEETVAVADRGGDVLTK